MRNKLQISFLTGLLILITGIALICNYEGSATTWPLPIPDRYHFIILFGSVISYQRIVYGILK